jgi:4-hydroxymandelate oxidase
MGPADDRQADRLATRIDVFDFELVAQRNVPLAHFGYTASGVDDEVTLCANREGFHRFQLKPRRLVDFGKIDTRMELFGEIYGSPSVIAPTGSNQTFHSDGGLGVSRADLTPALVRRA